MVSAQRSAVDRIIGTLARGANMHPRCAHANQRSLISMETLNATPQRRPAAERPLRCGTLGG
jgi:hypothetical protein